MNDGNEPVIILTIITILILIGVGFASGTIFGKTEINQTIINHNYINYDNLTQTLDKINLNCGSTIITKKYGDENYYIFTNKCIEGNFCKMDYILLEECLK